MTAWDKRQPVFIFQMPSHQMVHCMLADVTWCGCGVEAWERLEHVLHAICLIFVLRDGLWRSLFKGFSCSSLGFYLASIICNGSPGSLGGDFGDWHWRCDDWFNLCGCAGLIDGVMFNLIFIDLLDERYWCIVASGSLVDPFLLADHPRSCGIM